MTQISAISTLSNAAVGAIAAAGAPMATLQSRVQAMISTAEATVASIPAFGQIVPGQPMAAQVANLIAQCAAAGQLPALYELNSIATRTQANLALVAGPVGNNQAVRGGGNLYQLAAQSYGDATRWTDIARASGIVALTTEFQTYRIEYLGLLKKYLPPPPVGTGSSLVIVWEVYSSSRGGDVQFDVTNMNLTGTPK